MEHSIIFPLPFGLHVGFVIFSVIMLILCYKKKKYAYELYLLIGVASTMLVYVTEEKPFFYILGLEEIILFVLTVADMSKVSKKLRAEEKARLAEKEKADKAAQGEDKPNDADEAADADNAGDSNDSGENEDK